MGKAWKLYVVFKSKNLILTYKFEMWTPTQKNTDMEQHFNSHTTTAWQANLPFQFKVRQDMDGYNKYESVEVEFQNRHFLTVFPSFDM